jgi:hypothetical protein
LATTIPQPIDLSTSHARHPGRAERARTGRPLGDATVVARPNPKGARD